MTDDRTPAPAPQTATLTEDPDLLTVGLARLGAASLTPPPLMEDTVTTRRDLLVYLAANFTLPLPARLASAAAAIVPAYAGDAASELDSAQSKILDLGREYMRPEIASGPVQDQALAIWRDACVHRARKPAAGLANQALQIEAMSTTVIAHVMAERGWAVDARAWFHRAHDAASVLVGPRGDPTRANLLAVTGVLQILDKGDHLTAPAQAHKIGQRYLAGTTGAARASVLALLARTIATSPEPVIAAQALPLLLEADKHAPETAISLLGMSARQLHYVAAGVHATLGRVEDSRAHRQAYLSGEGRPGFMNALLLELGDVPNTLAQAGPDAAAGHVVKVIEAIPVERRSAPLRDRVVDLTRKLSEATGTPGHPTSYPQEVAILRQATDAMFDPGYLPLQPAA